jgi:hypothetical protein
LKRELAFQLLQRILPNPPWDEDRLRETLEDLRVLAEQKYNKYEMYQPARLFFENLYLFLNKMKEEDRTTALQFVRNDLIYISRDEFQQLAHVLYHDCIRQQQLDITAMKAGIPRHRLTKLVNSQEFHRIQRASLYVALSDGARIDYFRRQNLDINNEQVLAAYYVGDEKIKDLRQKLREDVGDSAAQFECIFLLDDFCGSGKTLLREVVVVTLPTSVTSFSTPDPLSGRLSFDPEKHKLQWNYRGPLSSGESSELEKLATSAELRAAIEELRQKCERQQTEIKGSLQRITTEKFRDLVSNDAAVYFAPLLATEYALNRLKPLIPRLSSPLDKLRVIPAAVLPDTVRISPDSAGLAELCDRYYDPTLGDEHTGNVKYGYDQCGLPLVLHHNAPNNSLFFLWARKWGSPLFPRYERHGREARG